MEEHVGRMAALVGAAMIAVTMSWGQLAGQVSFGGQFSVTNLGTESAKVGETLGVGVRMGIPVFENGKTTVMVEGVGEAMFPPCDDISCDLWGVQLNVVAMVEYNDRASIYGGLGPAYQTDTLEDETEGITADGHSFGVSMIIGTIWKASRRFQPFFEFRLSEMFDMRTQAAGVIGFRITPGAPYY